MCSRFIIPPGICAHGGAGKRCPWGGREETRATGSNAYLLGVGGLLLQARRLLGGLAAVAAVARAVLSLFQIRPSQMHFSYLSPLLVSPARVSRICCTLSGGSKPSLDALSHLSLQDKITVSGTDLRQLRTNEATLLRDRHLREMPTAGPYLAVRSNCAQSGGQQITASRGLLLDSRCLMQHCLRGLV